jgi:5-methylcytosine-specific restriction endonuclease McrA
MYTRFTLKTQWLLSRIEMQHNRCALCSGLMGPWGQPCMPGLQPTLDHIQPLSKGGLNTFENVQATHYKCNQKKGNQW